MCITKIVSSRSTCSVRKVGCVIVNDKRIISTGYNGALSGEEHCIDKTTEDKVYCKKREAAEKQLFCNSIHAEINALNYLRTINMMNSVINGSVYITTSPCINCAEILYRAGVKHIYYEYPYVSINTNKMPDNSIISEFDTFEQLTLTTESIEVFTNSIFNTSSIRTIPSLLIDNVH